MLRVVRKVMGHQHPDVEDVTQDAVLALLGSLETFRGACSVEHFARRIAPSRRWARGGGAKVRSAPEAEAEGGAIDDLPGDEPARRWRRPWPAAGGSFRSLRCSTISR